MTPISPRDGSRTRARRLLSRLAAVLVVGSVVLGSGLLHGGSPAAADENAPEPDDATIELSVAVGSTAQVDPAGPAVGRITITNGTESTLGNGSATLEVNPTPLADGAALDAWLDEGTAPGAFRIVATESTTPVGPGESAEITTVADIADPDPLAPGVYPVKARLTGASTDDADATAWNLTATSVMVVAPATPATVGILVPITATPEDGALLSASELTELTAPEGMLTGQLDAITGTAAVLAVDPAIPAAIRLLGSRAPLTAVDWLDRLERLPNEVIALRFADADPATQSHSSQDSLLATPDLTALMQTADFPSATPSPQPTASATTTPEPALPDNAALTAIAGEQTDILWPRPDVTAADLAAFDAYLGASATTILPSSSFEGTPPAHVQIDGHSILVTDADASARLSAAAELTDPTAVERALAAAAGRMFFASQESPTVLVGLERSETRSPEALRSLLSAFASPTLRLSAVQAAPTASARLATTVDGTRPAALTAMLAGEQRLQAFSSILEVPDLLLAPERIRTLRAIGVGLDDEEFTAATAERATRVQETLAAVSIQRPKPVQLIASAAPLPVWIRNDLPWPVRVLLHSEPSDPRLDIQSTTEVEAGRASATRVDVPIAARVASGEVQVEFRLTSTGGVPIGPVEVADVTLRADWEGIGLGILGGVIALLLIFGLIRTVRRKRRAAEAGTADAGRTTDAGAADAPAEVSE